MRSRATGPSASTGSVPSTSACRSVRASSLFIVVRPERRTSELADGEVNVGNGVDGRGMEVADELAKLLSHLRTRLKSQKQTVAGHGEHRGTESEEKGAGRSVTAHAQSDGLV